jgi:hypothetical protein
VSEEFILEEKPKKNDLIDGFVKFIVKVESKMEIEVEKVLNKIDGID